jgi:hypothetical protein
MNALNDLSGTLVLVHPALPHDEAGNQNNIGMITDADLDRDEVLVTFGKGDIGLYSADALLVLKSANDIHRNALDNHQQLDTADFKSLLSMALLRQSGGYSDTRKAFEMVMNNNRLLEHSMVALDESLDLEQAQSMGR